LLGCLKPKTDVPSGQAHLFRDEGVGAIFAKPLLRVGTAQASVRFDGKLGKHSVDRHLLKVDGIIGLGRGLQSGSRHGLPS
jgi:hypothetical protein